MGGHSGPTPHVRCPDPLHSRERANAALTSHPGRGTVGHEDEPPHRPGTSRASDGAAHPRLSIDVTRARLGLAALLLAVYAGALVVLRGRPTIESDGGIFVSVAAGLARGYRLYSDVWDNKPPLFYYADALGFAAVGWRGVFLIDAVWVWIAGMAMGLLIRQMRARPVVAVVGALAYPLLLTGVWYYAGYSELPGLALAPLVGWLWLRGNAVLTGALLGVLAFERPDYAWVYLGLVLVPVVARTMRPSAFLRPAARGALGAVCGGALIAAILALRGELGGYISALELDMGYPARVLAFHGQPSGISGHLEVVSKYLFASPARAMTFWVCLTVCTVLAAWVLLGRGSSTAGVGTTERLLAASWLMTSVGVVAAMIIGALWRHNLELLALPSCLAMCFVMSVALKVVRPRAMVVVVCAAVALGVLVGAGGVTLSTASRGGSPQAIQPLSEWWTPVHSASATALNHVASSISHHGTSITYARLGPNDDDGHLAFIASDLRPVCPIFAQYPFYPEWASVAKCLAVRHPELILVDNGFGPRRGHAYLQLQPYIQQMERLLHTDYLLAGTTARGNGRVLQVWRLASR